MIKLIRYHLPPLVKHVLAPQNDFGMPKISWTNHKSFGIEETPPTLCWKKLPNNPVFFFWWALLRVFLLRLPLLNNKVMASFYKIVCFFKQNQSSKVCNTRFQRSTTWESIPTLWHFEEGTSFGADKILWKSETGESLPAHAWKALRKVESFPTNFS